MIVESIVALGVALIACGAAMLVILPAREPEMQA